MLYEWAYEADAGGEWKGPLWEKVYMMVSRED